MGTATRTPNHRSVRALGVGLALIGGLLVSVVVAHLADHPNRVQVVGTVLTTPSDCDDLGHCSVQVRFVVQGNETSQSVTVERSQVSDAPLAPINLSVNPATAHADDPAAHAHNLKFWMLIGVGLLLVGAGALVIWADHHPEAH